MGKGNRNSQKRLEKELANKEKILAKERAQKNKKRRETSVAAACIIIALLVVVVLAISILNESGAFLRMTNVVSQGDTEVNAAMMTYFVNDYIINWYNNYGIYVQFGLLSVDLTSDLKTQKLTSSDASTLGDASLAGKTWHDYFVDTALDNVEKYVTYAEAAKAAGLSLDDEDKAEIDEIVTAMKDALKANGMTFSDQYGKGIKEKDVRACYELLYLASMYEEHMIQKYNTLLKEEYKADNNKNSIVNFRENNKGSFYSADYLSYSITIAQKTYKNDEMGYDKAVENAKKCAEVIKAAKTPAEFVELVELYKKSPTKFMIANGIMESIPETEVNTETGSTTETGTGTETETGTTTETGTGTGSETESKTETETENPMSKYEGTIYWETKSELGNWIFGESGANVNNTLIVTEKGSETVTEKATTAATTTATEKASETETESGSESASANNAKSGTATETESTDATATETESNTETETNKKDDGKKTYETFKITVYMLLTKPAFDVTPTHDIAYLVSDNKDAAQKFLDEFLKSSDKSRESFVNMAEKHYDKLMEGHDHSNHKEGETDPVFSYSSITGAKQDYFADDYEAFNKWFSDESRKNGDCTAELIEVTVTSSDNKTTTTYYAVIFYSSQNARAWYIDALDGARGQKIEEWYKAELKKGLIEFNEKALGKIELIRFTSSGS